MAHHRPIGAGGVAYLDAGHFSTAAGPFLDFLDVCLPFGLLPICV